MEEYWILAYYKFAPLEDPALEVAKHHEFFDGRGMAGRVYLATEGVNGSVSGPKAECQAYMDWLKGDVRFATTEFKIDTHHENAFPRMTIKVREQLVALDQKVDPSRGGAHVSPNQWKKMLESGEYLLLDVRNDYEWDVGHFEGAERPPCASFRDAPAWAQKLKKERDPKKTKVMMCCTGGIRCELYSALMKDEGFDEVYQLDGGIIKYGQEEGGAHWKGKLFVFDDRLAVDVGGKKEGVGSCYHCGLTAERHYNCANMDCNRLYLSCESCLEKLKGCCAQSCQEGSHIRPVEHQRSPKPFRRWYTYFQQKR